MATREELLALYENSSGLPLDGAEVTIIAAGFGFNDRMPGRVGFKPTFRIEENGYEREEFFTIGDKGTAAADQTRVNDHPTRLPGRSNYTRLVNAARELLGDEVIDVIGDPWEAAGWIGTRWTLGTVEEDVVNPETKEAKRSTKVTLVAYHGKGEVAASSAPAPAVAAAESHGGLWDDLVSLAKGCDDHDAFLDAALEKFPEVEKDVGLRKAVYSDRAGSVWAEAQK